MKLGFQQVHGIEAAENSRLDFEYSRTKKKFALKFGYLSISAKISILEHMLLHKLYMNMAIANIFLCRKSLYDLQERK